MNQLQPMLDLKDQAAATCAQLLSWPVWLYLLTPVSSLAVQSTLLLLLTLGLAWMLRNKSAALRVTVLRAGLMALGIAPVAAIILTFSGAPGAMLRWSGNSLPMVQPAESLQPETTPQGAVVSPSPLETTSLEILTASDPANASFSNLSPVASFRISLILLIPAVWLLGMGLLLFRLLRAHAQLSQLRRAGQTASEPIQAACHSLASDAGISCPEVRITGSVQSPCLMGIRRPVILLPETESLPIQEVLLHELAHMARRDCAWTLFSRVLHAVLFFQPLMWLAQRWIDNANEEAADDFVLSTGRDQHAYARCLVKTAEQFQMRSEEVLAGAGVVPFRSALGRRVARILDTTRPLTTHLPKRIQRGMTALALASGLVAAFLVAGQTAQVSAGNAMFPVNAIASAPQTPVNTGAPRAELALIAAFPFDDPNNMWGPDGKPATPLSDEPRDRVFNLEQKNVASYYFDFSLFNAARDNLSLYTQIMESKGSCISYNMSTDAQGRSFAHLIAILDENAKYVDINLGIAIGVWRKAAETKRSTDGWTPSIIFNDFSGNILLPKPVETDGKTYIYLTHQPKSPGWRIVAYDNDGNILKPDEKTQHTSSNKLTQSELYFDKPLNELKSIAYEVSPVYWTIFKNVPLALGEPAMPPATSRLGDPLVSFELRWCMDSKDKSDEDEMLPTADDPDIFIRTNPTVILTQDNVLSASVVPAENAGQYAILAKLTKASGARLAETTEKNINHKMAIIIDGKVVATPVVRSSISDNVMIAGSFTQEKAALIAKGLSGEKPTP